MFFKWKEFCDRHQIRYISKGPNTAHNHISIHCPFCGESDTSEHLGLSLDARRPAWGCWRSRSHRGMQPQRLIAALLNCSSSHADALVKQGSLPELDSFEGLFNTLEKSAPQVERLSNLRFMREFKPIDSKGYGRQFLTYLDQRGFNDKDYEPHMAADVYQLQYTLTGTFAWRLILPIYYQHKLVGWTGRDITGKAKLRYDSLTDKPELAKLKGTPVAPMSLKSLVLWQDYVEHGGECLLIVEGPLDALKIDFYNEEEGFVTTCLFGKPTQQQVRTLALAARKFKWVGVLLDPDAWSDAMSFVDELQALSGKRVHMMQVPEGAEDPGAMTCEQVLLFVQHCNQLKDLETSARCLRPQ